MPGTIYRIKAVLQFMLALLITNLTTIILNIERGRQPSAIQQKKTNQPASAPDAVPFSNVHVFSPRVARFASHWLHMARRNLTRRCAFCRDNKIPNKYGRLLL